MLKVASGIPQKQQVLNPTTDSTASYAASGSSGLMVGSMLAALSSN